jgi:hypothetical protein
VTISPLSGLPERLRDRHSGAEIKLRPSATAPREAGHHTHGDAALDLVPASPTTQSAWDTSADAPPHDIGWTPACAASGSRPACPLAPTIQIVGDDGYAQHGSPRT